METEAKESWHCLSTFIHEQLLYELVQQTEPRGPKNRKPDDQKKDQTTQKAKNHKSKQYCFKPNIRSNLSVVNFDVLLEKGKKLLYIEDFIYVPNMKNDVTSVRRCWTSFLKKTYVYYCIFGRMTRSCGKKYLLIWVFYLVVWFWYNDPVSLCRELFLHLFVYGLKNLPIVI